jgi:ferredoxin
VAEAPRVEAKPAKPAAKPPAAPAAVAAPAGAPAMTVAHLGETFELKPDQSLLDALIEKGLATDKHDKIDARVRSLWECKTGSCGKCILKVTSGVEAIGKATSKEKRTLGMMVDVLKGAGMELDGVECRLACMSKATGPVGVDLLGNTEVE